MVAPKANEKPPATLRKGRKSGNPSLRFAGLGKFAGEAISTQRGRLTMSLAVGETDKHVQQIADENQIVIHRRLNRLSRSYSIRVSEEIYITPIRSELSYAVALLN